MANEPFVWGAAGERLTPSEVKQKRRIAEALLAQAGDTSPVGHWTAALNRALQGYLGGRANYKASKSEREGTEADRAKVAAALAGVGTAPVSSALAGAGTTPVASGGTDPVSTPIAYTAPAEAGVIRQGLIDRGLPEHIADGFIMNFMDESGLNPGINEKNPIVPGSRGGFGLYQLTGDRRTAYEKFSAERGVDPADVDAQLDWLMYELQGPEAKAAESIFAATDAGSAGAAIVNNFLRPAQEHRVARANRYTGGAAPSFAPSGPSSREIAALLSDLWDPEAYSPQLSAMMQQAQAQENAAYEAALKQQDPMYQAQLEAAQLANAQARQPQQNEYEQRAAAASQFGLQPGTQEYQSFILTGDIPAGTKPTGNIQDYEYYSNAAVSRGEQPMPFEQYQATIARAGSGSNPLMGSIPAGYRAIQDPLTGQVTGIEPIPGSPAEQEAAAAANKMVAREGIADAASDTVLNAASRALEASRNRFFGVYGQGVLSNLPWTNDAETMRQVNALQSIAASENINAMRQASPTGGALGNASDADIRLLKEKSGALDPASPNFERDLADYTRTLLRTIHGTKAGDEIFEKSWSGSPNTKEGTAKITSKADYDALPSGATFIAPDGTTRRKP